MEPKIVCPKLPSLFWNHVLSFSSSFSFSSSSFFEVETVLRTGAPSYRSLVGSARGIISYVNVDILEAGPNVVDLAGRVCIWHTAVQ